MAKENSLADKLVVFMRMRDEARAKVDALPHDGETWPTFSVLMDEQEKAVANALYEATMTADRLGRLAAELAQSKKQKA